MSTPLACQARNLTVAYHAAPVLTKVNFEVPQGVVMGVVGPNGAGKSTLLKAMLGLVPPLAGQSLFFDAPLSQVRSRVGYMPQAASVDWDFPTTVLDVVTMGTYGRLKWLARPGRKEKDQARAALELTGIGELAGRQIGQLSGGQRQRVFLARTLAQGPDLYVLDEPFQGIDARSEAAMVDVLHSLREQGKTIVMVHHDLATVRHYCDHVTLLNKRVIACGPAEQAFTKQTIAATYDVAHIDDAFLEFVS